MWVHGLHYLHQQSGPNFIALLTVSQNRRLRKQGILCLRQAHFTGKRRILASVCLTPFVTRHSNVRLQG